MTEPTCARCGQPIRPDQEFWEPAVMDGPVHKSCPEAGGGEAGPRGRRDSRGAEGASGLRGKARGGDGGTGGSGSIILPD